MVVRINISFSKNTQEPLEMDPHSIITYDRKPSRRTVTVTSSLLPYYDAGTASAALLPRRILLIEYKYQQAAANSSQSPRHQLDSSSFLQSASAGFWLVVSVSRSYKLLPFPKVLGYDPSVRTQNFRPPDQQTKMPYV